MVRNNWLYLHWVLHTLMKGDKAVKPYEELSDFTLFT